MGNINNTFSELVKYALECIKREGYSITNNRYHINPTTNKALMVDIWAAKYGKGIDIFSMNTINKKTSTKDTKDLGFLRMIMDSDRGKLGILCFHPKFLPLDIQLYDTYRVYVYKSEESDIPEQFSNTSEEGGLIGKYGESPHNIIREGVEIITTYTKPTKRGK